MVQVLLEYDGNISSLPAIEDVLSEAWIDALQFAT